jgi:hemerythrin-like domain-containing protein
MLRDKNLIPLSRQHQHALALCVRLDRALQGGEVDGEAWSEEIRQIFAQEVATHFAAEEKVVFPAAAAFPDLHPLVEQLLAEHVSLRDLFTRATIATLDVNSLRSFVDKLSSHIRKEERQLFEGLQKVMTPAEFTRVGKALEEALADASTACILPNEATRLRPRDLT